MLYNGSLISPYSPLGKRIEFLSDVVNGKTPEYELVELLWPRYAPPPMICGGANPLEIPVQIKTGYKRLLGKIVRPVYYSDRKILNEQCCLTVEWHGHNEVCIPVCDLNSGLLWLFSEPLADAGEELFIPKKVRPPISEEERDLTPQDNGYSLLGTTAYTLVSSSRVFSLPNDS